MMSKRIKVNDLPPEILGQVFSQFSDPFDVVICAGTCKTWRQVVQDLDSCFKRIAKNLIPKKKTGGKLLVEPDRLSSHLVAPKLGPWLNACLEHKLRSRTLLTSNYANLTWKGAHKPKPNKVPEDFGESHLVIPGEGKLFRPTIHRKPVAYLQPRLWKLPPGQEPMVAIDPVKRTFKVDNNPQHHEEYCSLMLKEQYIVLPYDKTESEAEARAARSNNAKCCSTTTGNKTNTTSTVRKTVTRTVTETTGSETTPIHKEYVFECASVLKEEHSSYHFLMHLFYSGRNGAYPTRVAGLDVSTGQTYDVQVDNIPNGLDFYPHQHHWLIGHDRDDNNIYVLTLPELELIRRFSLPGLRHEKNSNGLKPPLIPQYAVTGSHFLYYQPESYTLWALPLEDIVGGRNKKLNWKCILTLRTSCIRHKISIYFGMVCSERYVCILYSTSKVHLLVVFDMFTGKVKWYLVPQEDCNLKDNDQGNHHVDKPACAWIFNKEGKVVPIVQPVVDSMYDTGSSGPMSLDAFLSSKDEWKWGPFQNQSLHIDGLGWRAF